jgi:hypothetical protein
MLLSEHIMGTNVSVSMTVARHYERPSLIDATNGSQFI